MNCLKLLLGSLVLSFAALYNVELNAEPNELLASYEEALESDPSEVTFESSPVVQELPDYSANWLDGRVSLRGGEFTTSQRQYLFAEANGIPVVTNRNFAQLVADGHLVRLSGPYLRFKSSRVVPYVLPRLRDITVALSETYYKAGCGFLTINSALRLGNRRPLWNSSPYSVHPRGMAVDVRTNEGLIGTECAAVIWDFAETQESLMIADATRETCTRRRPCPHLHLVVVPGTGSELNDLVARYASPPQPTDQSE